MYVLEAYYKPLLSWLSGSRRCHLHPANAAVAWELNQRDASYKRPVCEGCVPKEVPTGNSDSEEGMGNISD